MRRIAYLFQVLKCWATSQAQPAMEAHMEIGPQACSNEGQCIAQAHTGVQLDNYSAPCGPWHFLKFHTIHDTIYAIRWPSMFLGKIRWAKVNPTSIQYDVQ